MNITREQVKLAGRIIKVMRLTNQPGMDRVAIALNTSGLTYSEESEASTWAAAFELAVEGGKPMDLAARLLGAK